MLFWNIYRKLSLDNESLGGIHQANNTSSLCIHTHFSYALVSFLIVPYVNFWFCLKNLSSHALFQDVSSLLRLCYRVPCPNPLLHKCTWNYLKGQILLEAKYYCNNVDMTYSRVQCIKGKLRHASWTCFLNTSLFAQLFKLYFFGVKLHS